MNKYQIKLTRVWDTYAEIEALTMEDALTMYDAMVTNGTMAQKELEQMGISDESYKVTLLEPKESDGKTYVLFGSDMVRTADETLLDAKAIAETIHNGVNSMTNLQAFEPNTPIGYIIESVIGWGGYMVIDKAKYDEIKSEVSKLELPVLEPTQSVLGAWRDNDQEEGCYYARQCDITGEGMNEGWVVSGGFFYIKHESDAIAYCKEKWNQTLQEAYEESEENGGDGFYWTSWEDESDFQYILVDGVLVDYEEPIDEDTLKQEYMTSTEEMQHRMAMILDDLAKIRKWSYTQDSTEEIQLMFNNIQIACDIDDNECLTWSKYKD
jgi:hypothetical protein